MLLREKNGEELFLVRKTDRTQILTCRLEGGRRVTVWAGVGYYGNTEIKFTNGKMKSSNCITLIDEQLKKYIVIIPSTNFIFQQNNTSIRKAKSKEYFRQ